MPLKVEVSARPLFKVRAEAVLVYGCEEQPLPAGLPREVRAALRKEVRLRRFRAEAGQTIAVDWQQPRRKELILVGLGKKNELTPERTRAAARCH